MQQVTIVSKPAKVAENDLVSVSEAARISGRNIATIMGLMDRFVLPWYQLRAVGGEVAGERVQRFTSRAAVEALPKVRRPPKPRKSSK